MGNQRARRAQGEAGMSSWVAGSPATWLCLLREAGDRACVWVEGGTIGSV